MTRSPLSRAAARLALLATLLLPPLAAHAFGFDDVAARAQRLAAEPYQPAPDTLSPQLKNLDYDRFRDIRFKPAHAHWRDAGLPFELTFFHQAWHYTLPVKIHEVRDGEPREIRLDPAHFDYGANRFDPAALKGAGFAGFRVHYPVNTPEYKDEVLVFLGASYFRALGQGQLYGLSARGLAIDTAQAGGEEFPRFVEFWLERPAPGARQLTVYALLDSPRASGAYRFVLTPGSSTVMDVSARLYLRAGVGKLGIAPLTSMMLSGENQPPLSGDYRPEVHDSDGLALHAGSGEWLWRPLLNPKTVLTTSFATVDPKGFGLLQRDRDFARYEDLEARYELRPSAWVEPRGNWGAGRVELVQIPTPDETHDNIVAYWVPDAVPAPNTAYDFAYRLSWQKNDEVRPPSAWVVQSRLGKSYDRNRDNSVGFILEFDGPALRALPADARPEAVVTLGSNGRLLENTLYRNTVTGAWRQSLRVDRPDKTQPLELRSYLRHRNDGISETWSYILPPE